MPAEKISLKNAKENKLFYFVANVVVYRESDGRCLWFNEEEVKNYSCIAGIIEEVAAAIKLFKSK